MKNQSLEEQSITSVQENSQEEYDSKAARSEQVLQNELEEIQEFIECMKVHRSHSGHVFYIFSS